MKDSPHVAITIRSFDLSGPAAEKLRENCTLSFINKTGVRLSETDLGAAVGDALGVIAGTETFSRAVLNQCSRLKVISRVGVGTDTIDPVSAQEKGIRIAITPNAPVQSVAEHTVALILSVMKNIPLYNEQMRKNNYSVTTGSLLFGKTIGIIGIGRIGTRVAELLECLGCHILFYDPMIEHPKSSAWIKVNSMEKLIRDSDIVSIHTTPLPNRSPLIDANVLSQADGITLINTARGSLIDEPSLITALSKGNVKAAGFDVFSHEPYSGELLAFPQVITTPHVASNTVESRQQMEMEAVDNLIHYLSEDKL